MSVISRVLFLCFVGAASATLANHLVPPPTIVWSIPANSSDSFAVYADDTVGVLLDAVAWTLSGVRWTTRGRWTAPSACANEEHGILRSVDAFSIRSDVIGYVCRDTLTLEALRIVQLNTSDGRTVASTPVNFSTSSNRQFSLSGHAVGKLQSISILSSVTTGTFCGFPGWCVFSNGTFWELPSPALYIAHQATLLAVHDDVIAARGGDDGIVLYNAATGATMASFQLNSVSTGEFGRWYGQAGEFLCLAEQVPGAVAPDQGRVYVVDLKKRTLLPNAVLLDNFFTLVAGTPRALPGASNGDTILTFVTRALPISWEGVSVSETVGGWHVRLSAFLSTVPTQSIKPSYEVEMLPPSRGFSGADTVQCGAVGVFDVCQQAVTGNGEVSNSIVIVSTATGQLTRIPTTLLSADAPFRFNRFYLAGATIFVNGGVGVLAINASDGTALWQSQTDKETQMPRTAAAAETPATDRGSGCVVLIANAGTAGAQQWGFECVALL